MRKFIWIAVGMLLLLLALFGFAIVSRESGEAITTPTEIRPTKPVLAAAPSNIPIQTSVLLPTIVATPETPLQTATQTNAFLPSETTDNNSAQVGTGTPYRPSGPSAATLTPQVSATAEGSASSMPSATGTTPRTPEPSPTLVSTTSISSPTPSPEPPATSAPSATPALSHTSTPTPRQTATPTATPTPSTPGISGRILLNGQPVEAGLVLVIEDQSFNTIAETTVGPDGRYLFANLPSTDEGYDVTFSWERNQTYGLDEVVAWGWIGPLAYDLQDAVKLPDLDIGLLGLTHIRPEPDTRHSAASITATIPMTFVWDFHPSAARYWVDILASPSLERVWRSPFTLSTSTEFAGQLDSGEHIQPGTYWWAVGGQSTRQGFQLTVYGHLASLRITS